MNGTFKLAGTIQGTPDFPQPTDWGPVTLTAANAQVSEQLVALAIGNNTVNLPVGTTAVAVIVPAGTTATIIVKGVNGDSSTFNLGSTGFFASSVNGWTSFVINASAVAAVVVRTQ